MNKPILCLDFDGVLHAYTTGWHGAGVVADGPVPGATAFVARCVAEFRVAVYSSRSSTAEGIRAMHGALGNWLRDEFGSEVGDAVLEQVEWPTEKPAAFLTLDDRAWTFTGEWPSVEMMKTFRPWNKK